MKMNNICLIIGLCLSANLFLIGAEQVSLKGRVEPIPTDSCATATVSFEDERLYLFSLSEDSVVWHKYQVPEGGWSTWKPLADRRKMGSGPQVVRFPNGTIQVFARGTDRQFYYTQMSKANEWSNWQSLGEKTFYSQPVPVITAAGSCLVFGVATETHSVWYTESSPLTSDSFSFSQWADLGGDSTGAPSVYLDSEALVHVFIRGTNRALWHLSEVYPRLESVPEGGSIKKWGNWECLGGVMASAPRTPISLNGANLVEVYGRAADKALWYRRQVAQQDGSSADWAEWHSLGGVLASGPAVSLSDDGLVSIYARATDKAIYFKSQIEVNDEIQFTQWTSLGGMFSATPSVAVRSDGTVDIFARGIDKAIWHSHQVETNGTRTFTSWHSLGGHTRKYAC